MGGLALDRNMGVLGHIKRGEAMIIGEFGGRRRGDSTVTGEQHKPVIHVRD